MACAQVCFRRTPVTTCGQSAPALPRGSDAYGTSWANYSRLHGSCHPLKWLERSILYSNYYDTFIFVAPEMQYICMSVTNVFFAFIHQLTGRNVPWRLCADFVYSAIPSLWIILQKKNPTTMIANHCDDAIASCRFPDKCKKNVTV